MHRKCIGFCFIYIPILLTHMMAISPRQVLYLYSYSTHSYDGHLSQTEVLLLTHMTAISPRQVLYLHSYSTHSYDGHLSQTGALSPPVSFLLHSASFCFLASSSCRLCSSCRRCCSSILRLSSTFLRSSTYNHTISPFIILMKKTHTKTCR